MEINELKREVSAFSSAIERDLGALSVLEDRLNGINVELEDLKAKSEVLSKVSVLFQLTAEYARNQAKTQIEDLVTRCLQFIFENDVEFLIEFDTNGNIPVGEFYIVSNYDGYTVKNNPENSRGGGVIDLISIALRISFLEIYKPRLMGPLILDEPGKHISEGYVFNLGDFLKETTRMFNRQIIMVTHNPTLSEFADESFSVSIKNGVSIISKKSATLD